MLTAGLALPQMHIALLPSLTKLECQGIRAPVANGALACLFKGLPNLQARAGCFHLALAQTYDMAHSEALGQAMMLGQALKHRLFRHVCKRRVFDEACSLSIDRPLLGIHTAPGDKSGFPAELLRCTKLTSLSIYDHESTPVLAWGGLPEGISALQQLRRLKLRDVLTEPLTDRASALTNLTSLGLFSDGYEGATGPTLPLAATVLTGLRQLDVQGRTMPPAVTALTGNSNVDRLF